MLLIDFKYSGQGGAREHFFQKIVEKTRFKHENVVTRVHFLAVNMVWSSLEPKTNVIFEFKDLYLPIWPKNVSNLMKLRRFGPIRPTWPLGVKFSRELKTDVIFGLNGLKIPCIPKISSIGR